MKLLIWGTGRLTGQVVGRYVMPEDVEAFIDNSRDKEEYMGKSVYAPEDVLEMEYDAILVATLFCKEIYTQCRELGIDLTKVIFLYGNCELKDVNQDYAFAEKILGKECADVVRKRYHVVRGVEAYGDLFLKNSGELGAYQEDDYVRIKCLELAVKEIRKKNLGGYCGGRCIPRRVCPVFKLCVS